MVEQAESLAAAVTPADGAGSDRQRTEDRRCDQVAITGLQLTIEKPA
jgi:hypothetical protein